MVIGYVVKSVRRPEEKQQGTGVMLTLHWG